MVEEQQTPVYVWGFDSHISESALFDFFDRRRATTLASVTLQRDAMNNSLRRATLMYGDIDEAKAVSRALSGLPLGLGEIHMSLECFPEEEIPPRVEEEQTPVYVWGFGSHISESALFDLFDKERKTSLASVTLHRDAMNNSLRRATLIYNSKVEAEVVSVVRNLQSLDVGIIHTSLKSFPEEAIPPRVEEEQTPVYVWGFGSHVSAMDIFDFFDRGRTKSLASVMLHGDAMNNSLRRATLMYGDKDEAKAVSRALSGLPLDLGDIHMSLECFPEEAIPARVVSNQMMTTTTPFTGTGLQAGTRLQASVPLQSYPTYQFGLQASVPVQSYPTYQLFPDHQTNLPRQGEVFVGNFSSTTTEEELKMKFSAHGHVENVSMIGKDGAFIKFRFPECATAAISNLNGFNCDGKVWHVRYWVQDRREEIRQGMEKRRICYVRNFKYDLEEAGLREMFKHCGEISYCKIRRDATGKSKGDGFLEFATAEAASEAMQLDGKFMVGGRTIYVKPAKSKE